MIGTTLAHYRILEQLGAGGMGVVYRARDEHLERDVALKVLPEGLLASAEAVQRFRREALALSRLSHPAIATVHDFDRRDGIDFLVMEYVLGATLADRLATGPMGEAEVVTLGTQIAEALEAAHEQGVVHRDLKPGNIMCTAKGQAKVLDFGLAKLVRSTFEQAMAQSMTETQAVLGTLPYMSPEQLLGKKADPRSDLYALGVVLYEMATGRRPFHERSTIALANLILNTPAPLPGSVRPGLSSRLEEIMLKCLEKDPELRYQSARELAVDLRRARSAARGAVTSGPTPSRAGSRSIESLAVLPLENLTGDPGQEYFVDGMTEALITDLAQIGALRVISRTSVMRYKGVRKSLPEVARELNVDAVVEGSVFRAGNRVRVTAQLIEAATDRHLWAKSYDRDLSDVLAMQSEVAQAIAHEIRAKLTPAEQTRLAGSRRVDPEAYEACLRGRFYWNKRTRDGVSRAIEYFKQAIEKDPGYASAYAGLADAYAVQGQNEVSPKEAFPQAKAAATKALEIDGALAEPHACLGMMMASEWDWPGAEREYLRSIELNPSHATAHQWYAAFLAAMERFDEAVAEIKRAHELDPLSLVISDNWGWVLMLARRDEEAIDQFKRTLELEMPLAQTHAQLGMMYMEKGMFDAATTEVLKAIEIESNNGFLVTILGCVYANSGRRAEAMKVRDDLVERSKQTYVPPVSMAELYCALGEKDAAFAWLKKACDDRALWIMHLRVLRGLDTLRSDPRFDALLRRVGLAP